LPLRTVRFRTRTTVDCTTAVQTTLLTYQLLINRSPVRLLIILLLSATHQVCRLRANIFINYTLIMYSLIVIT